MSLRLYNSRTRRQEEFTPIDPAHIGMYVCGPTVYDRAHIGNARPVVVFDLLFRLLRRRYGESSVTYARNITDVDDKIIIAAANNGEPIAALTRRTTEFYHADMAALNCLPPSIEPRATGHIPHMIAMIETLIAKGNAYEAEGHVLFAVATSPDYGALSGRNRDEQIAGARVEVAPYKRDPADFVLWKPSDTSEAAWDSPWGKGRPGWHIECSAMAAAHLGTRFDIHGGGIDLIFPHHENEVAQSTCAHDGAAPANVWMHNGHVVVEGQKMSKSLGNFITVEDLLKRWPGEVIRLALMSAHYRQPLDVTETLLAQAKARLDYMYGVLRRSEAGGGDTRIDAVEEALEDDLNTPQAMTVIQELAGQVEKDETSPSRLKASGRALGLLQMQPEAWFRWQPATAAGLQDDQIQRLVEERLTARKQKDFVRADELRALLAKENITLEDSGGETFWRRNT